MNFNFGPLRFSKRFFCLDDTLFCVQKNSVFFPSSFGCCFVAPLCQIFIFRCQKILWKFHRKNSVFAPFPFYWVRCMQIVFVSRIRLPKFLSISNISNLKYFPFCPSSSVWLRRMCLYFSSEIQFRLLYLFHRKQIFHSFDVVVVIVLLCPSLSAIWQEIFSLRALLVTDPHWIAVSFISISFEHISLIILNCLNEHKNTMML